MSSKRGFCALTPACAGGDSTEADEREMKRSKDGFIIETCVPPSNTDYSEFSPAKRDILQAFAPPCRSILKKRSSTPPVTEDRPAVDETPFCDHKRIGSGSSASSGNGNSDKVQSVLNIFFLGI